MTMSKGTKIKLSSAGIGVVLLAIFMIVNRQFVELDFLVVKVSLPRSVMLISVFGIGFGTGWAVKSLLKPKPKAERVAKAEESRKPERQIPPDYE